MIKSLKWAFLALVLFTLTLPLNSCKKSSTSAPKVKNSISLKYNGAVYTTSNVSAAFSKGAFQITGLFNTTTSVYLAVPNDAKVGSFDLSTGLGAATFASGTSNEYFGETGTITITSFTSNTVTGTFQFNGTDVSNGNACTITSGTFEANYTTM